jgi:hypothetical protein
MTEAIAQYSPEAFPYAGILEELSEEIRQVGMMPAEGYARFLDMRDAHPGIPNPAYLNYGSTAMTTGGHARVLKADAETLLKPEISALLRPDVSITTGGHSRAAIPANMGEVVAANTHTARQLAMVLRSQGVIRGNRFLLPVDLEDVGYLQSEYLTYWGFTITGPDLRKLPKGVQALNTFEKDMAKSMREHGVALEIMNNSSLSRDERRPQYANFIGGLIATLEAYNMLPYLPINELDSLVDAGISLGSDTEKVLAGKRGIPTKHVAAVQLAPSYDEVVPDSLRHDLHVIDAFGGRTIRVAEAGKLLALIDDQYSSAQNLLYSN